MYFYAKDEIITVKGISQKNPKFCIKINVKNIVKGSTMITVSDEDEGRKRVEIYVYPKGNKNRTTPIVIFMRNAVVAAKFIDLLLQELVKQDTVVNKSVDVTETGYSESYFDNSAVEFDYSAAEIAVAAEFAEQLLEEEKL